ncbi:MAG: TonB-dependent receptor [Acidobacteria bacterium]|nr:TonB-dependent receptor [Acidobacteriota bacterium]
MQLSFGRRVLGCGLAVWIGMLLFSVASYADSNATVTGQVTDPAGRAVAGAAVVLTNINTNIPYRTETNSEGIYRLTGLLPGIYRANVTRDGFKNIVKGDIELHVQDEVSLNFALQIGSVAESITVEGGAPLLETTNAQVSGLVSGRTLTELPLNGRDVSQLIVLQVGVAPSTTAGPSPISKGSVGKVAVNGTRQTMTNNTLDGADINDPEFGVPPGGVAGVQLGVEAIEEYRVILNPYDAQYGRNAGANVQYATKSGTNNWRGSLYEFHRNSVLDARNFFDTRKPRFLRNQFGVSAGGPVVRDKTFFFANYEGMRDRQSITTSVSVPDNNARSGLLPSAANPSLLVNVGVNPTSAPLLQLFPVANGPAIGNGLALFQGARMQPTREDFGVFRIDHRFSEKDQFFARVMIDDGQITQPFMSTSVPGFPGQAVIRNQYYMLNWQHLFSVKLFNEAKFDYNRTKYLADTANSYPYSISLLPNRALGLISIPGLPTVGNNLIYPIGETTNVFEGIDNVTYLHGAHALRFGGNVKRFQINGPFDLFTNGGYYFADLTVYGFPAASNNPGLEYFLYGVPIAYVGTDPAASNSYRAYRQNYFGFYAQDDWRITSQFTLNIGLRWEFWSNPTEAKGRLSTIRNLATDAAPTSGPMFARMSPNLWSPRLGFAWQPFKSGKTVVRGGFGILRDQIWADMYGNSRFYQPYYHSVEVIFPNFLTPPSSIASLVGPFGIPPITVGSFGIDYHAKQPYYEAFSLNIQQELTPTLMLQVGYSGNHGVHLGRGGEANPQRTINPNFGSMPVIVMDATSSYNALQVSLQKRFSNGLAFQTSYTYSKALDDESGALLFEYVSENVESQDLYNRKGSYGRSAFDRRQVFVGNFLYDLPFGPGKRYGYGLTGLAGKLAEGWRIGGIVSLESGPPFTANLGGFNNSGSTSGGFWPADRPNLAAGARPCASTGNSNQWFDPRMFTLPAPGQYGNAGRNIMCGPSLKDFDMTLAKQTRLNERINVEFRAEFFNLFNHPNFDVPVNTTGPNGAGGNGDQIFIGRKGPSCSPATDPLGCGILAPNAGRIFRTVTSSRQIQFGIKVTF